MHCQALANLYEAYLTRAIEVTYSFIIIVHQPCDMHGVFWNCFCKRDEADRSRVKI